MPVQALVWSFSGTRKALKQKNKFSAPPAILYTDGRLASALGKPRQHMLLEKYLAAVGFEPTTL